MTVCFLSDCLDIKNVEVIGVAQTGNVKDAHSWNKVEVDGKWYYFDPLWCANVKNKVNYYLTDKIWNDHVFGYEDNYLENGDIPYINSLF
jgi:transglutaminase/protease-like cytokinesis protein 3